MKDHIVEQEQHRGGRWLLPHLSRLIGQAQIDVSLVDAGRCIRCNRSCIACSS